MNIEGKRALLQRALDEGLEVASNYPSNPHKVLFVGKHISVLTDCYGIECSVIINNKLWRIIEKPKMAAGYRRYIYLNSEGKELVDTCVDCAGCCKPAYVQSSGKFIRWIDYEWQYEPVEQDHE